MDAHMVEELVDLYHSRRRNGVLLDDLKVQQTICIQEYDFAYIDLMKERAIHNLLNKITQIIIAFPEDTIHLKYVESTKEYRCSIHRGIKKEIVMTYYLLCG